LLHDDQRIDEGDVFDPAQVTSMLLWSRLHPRVRTASQSQNRVPESEPEPLPSL
jgi:hypothetical protein